MLLEENFLTRALRLAEEAAFQKEVPVGAVIVKENRIIAEAFNQREKDQSTLAHAECLAIMRANQALKSWRLTGCDLYVTLEPCPMCLAACEQARIRKVVYGAKDAKSDTVNLNSKVKIEAEYFQMKECETILLQFFKEKRK